MHVCQTHSYTIICKDVHLHVSVSASSFLALHMWAPQNLYLWCENISKVLLLFQRPVNLSDLSITIMVAASTVSSQLDSLWLLTCLFVSLFQGWMLPPNHILSILLSHQCTIKKKYIDCTVATLKPCTIPNWYQLNFLAPVLCHLFWPTRVPSFTSRLDTFCSNQPCQAFCGPWESRCSNFAENPKFRSFHLGRFNVATCLCNIAKNHVHCFHIISYLVSILQAKLTKTKKHGPWSWKPQNPLLRFHVKWTRMVRLDNLWWSNPKENIENGAYGPTQKTWTFRVKSSTLVYQVNIDQGPEPLVLDQTTHFSSSNLDWSLSGFMCYCRILNVLKMYMNKSFHAPQNHWKTFGPFVGSMFVG